MIEIFLGKVGSGKTASAVREMYINKSRRKTYSNIQTTLPNQVDLDSSMIIKKTQVGEKKTKGELIPVYEFALNVDFWKSIKEPINVVLDEIHNLANSRKSSSRQNIILGDFFALLRKILNEDSRGYGKLTVISQLFFRIDVILRESATKISYHVGHFTKTCLSCGSYWKESSETCEGYYSCPSCGSPEMKKHSHYIEVWCFDSTENYMSWKLYGNNSYYSHYIINDIQTIFPLYSTLQLDNLFSE